MKIEELIEILSNVEHTRWADWQTYLHNKCIIGADGSLVIPAKYAGNLARLINTPYSKLTEAEKESDRKEIIKILPIIFNWYNTEMCTTLEELKEWIASRKQKFNLK